STDGFFSDQPADSHGFTPGGYTLQLIVVDAKGLSAIDRVQLRVPDASQNQPPFATVSADPAGGAPPIAIKFIPDYGDPDGFVNSASWTFSDGSTVSDVTPTKSYDHPTQERAVFTVIDNRG